MKFNFDSKIVRTILIVICVILSLIMYMQRQKRAYFKQAAKLPFYNVQVQDVEDGTYRGKVYTKFIHVQLDVSVADGKLTQIQIVENEGAYGKKVAPILDQMILQNTSVVPAIEGEELASIAFIACVDDALFNGLSDEEKTKLSERTR